MRNAVPLILALVIIANAACYRSHATPKLTEITGLGEYLLGQTTTQLDLSECESSFEDRVQRIDTGVVWYIIDYDHKYEVAPELYGVLALGISKGRLEAIRLMLPLETFSVDEFEKGYNAKLKRSKLTANRVRSRLLARYSSEMIDMDTFDTLDDNLFDEKERVLRFKDKSDNALILTQGSSADSLVVTYCSSEYLKLYQQAMNRYKEERKRERQMAKHVVITGYGEYMLGAAVSGYDLTRFKAPTKDYISDIETGALAYEVITNIEVEDSFYETTLTLYVIGDSIEGISYDFDADKCFTDRKAAGSFVMNIRKHILDEYFYDLIVYDSFDASVHPEEASEGHLLIKDKDGNTMSLINVNLDMNLLDIHDSFISLDVYSGRYNKSRELASQSNDTITY